MMKNPIAIFLILVNGLLAHSQTAISFCTVVDPQSGYCVFDNTKFITPQDSTSARIYIKIGNASGFSSDSVVIKIFSVGKGGEETYSHSLVQKIEKGWDMCWQNDKFPSPGTYLIKVYNDANLLICSKSFELIKFW